MNLYSIPCHTPSPQISVAQIYEPSIAASSCDKEPASVGEYSSGELAVDSVDLTREPAANEVEDDSGV